MPTLTGLERCNRQRLTLADTVVVMAQHGMERRHLEEANRHLAEGAERIAKQEALIATLDRDGLHTEKAVRLLGLLRDTQEQGVVHRNMILKALGEPEDGSAAQVG